ncbi:carbonic anhydrase [Brevundimonas sp.]|uniref:carbonic anhydrase n=1 Tax=Brevundimonas sp. TaxID=1871086 RepID=UPI00344B859A
MIACSDSRIDPQTIFDAEPGDLFVIRNVAGLVSEYAPDWGCHGTSAALEFAVKIP